MASQANAFKLVYENDRGFKEAKKIPEQFYLKSAMHKNKKKEVYDAHVLAAKRSSESLKLPPEAEDPSFVCITRTPSPEPTVSGTYFTAPEAMSSEESLIEDEIETKLKTQEEVESERPSSALSYVDEKVEYITQDEPDIVSVHQVIPRHCVSCPTYDSYVRDGGRPNAFKYEEFCNMRHDKVLENADVMDTLIEASTDYGNLEKRPVVVSVQKPDQPKINLPGYKERTEAQQTLQRMMTPYIMNVPKEIKVDPRTPEARYISWQHKARMLIPTVRSATSEKRGGELWDLMYPLSLNRRLLEVPYTDVMEYPTIRWPEEDCLIVALAAVTGSTPEIIFTYMLRAFPRSNVGAMRQLEEKTIWPVALHFGLTILVNEGRIQRQYGLVNSKLFAVLDYDGSHYVPNTAAKLSLVIRPKAMSVLPQRAPFLKAVNNWALTKRNVWKPEVKRAEMLIRAMLAGEIGTMNTPVNQQMLLNWSAAVDMGKRTPEKELFIVQGDPGCRKSTFPQKLMRQMRQVGYWNMVAPTVAIADDYRAKLDATTEINGKKMFGAMVSTWEKAIAYSYTSTMMVADENKYPPGYIALYHILNPECKAQLFLGDAWQASWHSPTPTKLNDQISEMEFYSQYTKGYILGTWRFAGMSAAFWRMPSYSKVKGNWAFSDFIPTSWEQLRPHFPTENDATLLAMFKGAGEIHPAHYDTIVAEELRGSDAMSYSSSIGKTLPLAIIVIDERVINGGDCKLIYTAMTRSANILFVRSWRPNGQTEQKVAFHPVFSVLEKYRLAYIPYKLTQFKPEWSVSIRNCTNPFPEEWEFYHAGPFEKCTNYDLIGSWWPHILDEHGEKQWEHFVDPDAIRGGGGLRYDDEVYADQPSFWPFIDQTVEYEPEEPSVFERGVPNPKPKTSIPIGSRAQFEEENNAQIKERFTAEIAVNGEYTDQFPDGPRLLFDSARRLAELAEKFKGPKKTRFKRAFEAIKEHPEDDPRYSISPILQWAAFQKSNDRASYLLAKAKRIRYSTIEDNLANLERQKFFGMCCFDAFRIYMGWTQPFAWDDRRYALASVAFQERRNDRPAALKKASLNRADADAQIMLTLKQQLKLKEGDNTVAKSPQPVWIHPDSQLFAEGPYGVLLLELLLEHKPDYWHFHAKMSYEQFETWCAKYMTDCDEYEMSDQTGQDQAAQGWAVTVFECLLRWFNFPEEAINQFKHLKLTKVLNGHIVAIMTDSGEVWTYLINTVSSTARECFMYDIKPGHPMANGGDDTMRKPIKVQNPNYDYFRDMDPCVDKRYISPKGDFTSHRVYKGVLYKNPILLLKRFLVKLASGRGEESVLGYAEMWKRNYDLKEQLFDVFTEEEMEAHAIMTRIFFNLKKEGLRTRLPFKFRDYDDFEIIPTLRDSDFTFLEKVQNLALFAGPTQADVVIQDTANDPGFYAYTAQF
jgi:hypothetical protein